ncbi:MAG: transposase [Pseudohongiellaceae bacterium]
MTRQRRMFLAGVPSHVIQRGNNRNACFFNEQDYLFYLKFLGDACLRYNVSLHAYVLMTNHIHLLMTPADDGATSRVMHSLGTRYVQYINKRYRRSGTLWEGRPKDSLIDTRNYLLACYRYIELNPVRAGMTRHPGEYRWSSYWAHAFGRNDPLIKDHDEFLALHPDHESRQRCYRELFTEEFPIALLNKIRGAASCSRPLGNARFIQQVEAASNRGLVRIDDIGSAGATGRVGGARRVRSE